MGRLKVVTIGAGGRANQVIYPSFHDLVKAEKVEFAGICGIDPERLTSTAGKYGIQKRYGAGACLVTKR
jgi:predicted dehydrogenase